MVTSSQPRAASSSTSAAPTTPAPMMTTFGPVIPTSIVRMTQHDALSTTIVADRSAGCQDFRRAAFGLDRGARTGLGSLDPRRHGGRDCCASLIALCNTHRLESPMASDHAAAREYVLTLSCRDTPGIVYAVSSFVVQQGGNISQSQQFDDRLGDQFFMRVQFTVANDDLAELREGFARVAQAFQMSWQIHDAATPTRVLLLVSRFGHCLNDLLFRTRIGALNVEIPAIVS